jgi:mannose-6-phosphate isomerase-like protein (cupin superfamily)
MYCAGNDKLWLIQARASVRHEGRRGAMKRLLLTALMAAPLCFGQGAVPINAPGGGPGVPGSGWAANGAPKELPSNQESGVETDRFIGYPSNSFTKVLNGGLMTQSMLRNGDPYHPGPSGNVLEYRDDLAVATLEPHFETGTMESPEIYFYYVYAGVGHFDSGPGTKSYDVHQGVGILIAPGAKQHFVNTGDKQISMIMLTWKGNDGMTVKQPVKVVDTTMEQLGENRAHWVMTGKHMFDNADGVNITMSAIYIPSGTYSGPHAHVSGVEEIWVKTGSDLGYAILGSEIRKIDGPGAFLAPPNGKTTHSSMNLNADHPAVWLYLSRRAPQPASPATSTTTVQTGGPR